jgi:hypothetical protein
VLRQKIGHESGDRKCAPAVESLHLLAVAPAVTHPLKCSNNPYASSSEVKIRSLQSREFTPAWPEISTCVDERFVAGIDGRSETFDLVRGKKAWLGPGHAREHDRVARGLSDQPLSHRLAHETGKDTVGVPDRARSQYLGHGVDPRLHGQTGDLAKRHFSKGGHYLDAEVVFAAGTGGRTDVASGLDGGGPRRR